MSPPNGTTDSSKKGDGYKRAQEHRARLLARLKDENEPELVALLERCGRPLKLVCCGCKTAKVVEFRCDRRWCPVCARKIAAERVARYAFAVARMQWPLFVTLTVQNSLEAWEGIKRLKSAWGKMRRSKWFKGCDVKGGVTAIEITNRGNGWHPHLHSVIDCRWLAVRTPRPQRGTTKQEVAARCAAAKAELDAEWARITRQPTASTYVKRTDRLDLREVLKYSADPGTLANEQGRIGELIRAIDTFRMVQPFGSCMGIGAEIRELAAEERTPPACPCCQGTAYVPELTIERPDRPAGPSWRPRAVPAYQHPCARIPLADRALILSGD